MGVGGGGGGEYDGSGVADESGLTARQREARTLYRRATNYEMDGEHMDAIRYYRRVRWPRDQTRGWGGWLMMGILWTRNG